MEKAQKAVKDFMSRDGQHNTVVDEDYRAAVTEEHIRPSRHEEITTAIDKEIHQDHHHTTIQPIKHSEILPETHTYNALAVENKAFEHDNPSDVRATLDSDAARYRDSSMTHETTRTTANAPVITGEHVHHHLHEHIQPVIYKDTHAPEVVHTTVPIHEVHHAPTVHHSTTTLPTKTWAEFEAANGPFTGRETRTVNEYEGCAKPSAQGDGVDTAMTDATQGNVGTDSMVDATNSKTSKSATATGAAAADTSAANGEVDPLDPATGVDGSATADDPSAETAARTAMSDEYQMSNQATTGAYGDAAVPRSSDLRGTERTTLKKSLRNSQSGASNTSRGSKVSLKDKLNPFKDADGDGKKGIMS